MFTCEDCEKKNTILYWCKACNAKHFQQNFINWTSGNDDIDKFIQDTQLSSINYYHVLEWLPYNRFYDIEYITEGGFGKVYKAKWIDGYILSWDSKIQNWKRIHSNKFVALKSLYNSENVIFEFINEITMHCKAIDDNDLTFATVRVYGITQDPETKNYMIVLPYAENGSLRNYLDKSYYELSWNGKFTQLCYIAHGLGIIHRNRLIHRDLHTGNILLFSNTFCKCTAITDMGLCKPADYNATENTKNSIYGVLPYIAPEILRGQNYTKAADIYSFGIIIYEVIPGLPPYHDLSHNEYLAIKICQGLRPSFNIKVPQLIVHLIKRCLDANPLNRPVIDEIKVILFTFYTSRLLNFNNLPEPKNSDDYYDEQNDNIISEKFSESLQIDLSQLKINNDDQIIEPKDEGKV
ncbi:hypothetical protein RclHR1_05610008 [Rhizophagus clarus]|uniref:Protein kinase domain-containing protein n=1 Tax=Rhizophagus clarus TaxID=94130 RepID=A0A2Z6RPZ1_9GLOM|nr:hypothetical protein RclHR1_05610008 [Rhizophagus clarus]